MSEKSRNALPDAVRKYWEERRDSRKRRLADLESGHLITSEQILGTSKTEITTQREIAEARQEIAALDDMLRL